MTATSSADLAKAESGNSASWLPVGYAPEHARCATTTYAIKQLLDFGCGPRAY
jgi:hypothetical protein